MNSVLAARIGKEMLTIIKDIIWDHVVDIADARGFGRQHNYKLEVGTGNATYHQYRRLNNKDARSPFVHKIVIGRKMILAKADPAAAKRWLTYTEMVRYNYFPGNLTYASVLAHTLLHECGHALQVICKERPAGSVHNDKFYRSLTDLHWACGAKVLERMNDVLGRLCPEQIWSVSTRKPKAKTATPFKVGDLLVDNSESERNFCVVTGLGQKRVRCYFYSGPFAGRLMFINPRNLDPISNGDPQPEQRLISELFNRRVKDDEILILIGDAWHPAVVVKPGRLNMDSRVTAGPHAGKLFTGPKEFTRRRYRKPVSA